jgi:DNA-directed RNA polymerase subunit L
MTDITDPTEIINFKSYKYDMKAEEIKYRESNGLNSSYLKLKLYGNDLNVKLVNSLRRCISDDLPCYAIPPELITIETNTCVAFNNDYMRLRLSQLPVLGVDSNIFFMPEKYWKNVNYNDTKREKHKKEEIVEMYINVHNNSSEIMNLTTDNISMYVGGEKIMPYSKKYPILLVKLKPNDRFKCHMKAVLGVGTNHAIWNMSKNPYYDYIIDDKKKEKYYEFTVKGNMQCNEYEILIRGCKYLIKRVNDIKSDLEKKIKSKEIISEKKIHFHLNNENHTLGEILNYEFQDHKDILGSGLIKPDHLIKAIIIKIECVPDLKSPLDAMIESMDSLVKKISNFGKIISDLSKSVKH